VPAEHTAQARERLGPGKLLAPEQAVLLVSDRSEARRQAREHVRVYLGLPNYVNNLRRLGWDDEDLDGPGSDKLVDAIVVWGDEAAIRARVDEHFAAGADHVCVQVLTGDLTELPMDHWRRLAPALLG
jgi:probable F420-dependent oxidoreductase